MLIPNSQKNELLETYISRLDEAFEIKGLILFGSQAKGLANYRSDIDLLIISDDMGDNWFKRHRNAYSVSEGGVQPFIVTSEDFSHAFENRYYIVWEALEDGIVLRESELIDVMKTKLIELKKNDQIKRREKGWTILSDLD